VYELVGSSWVQVGADLDADGAGWELGWSVALSDDGARVAAGAPGGGRVKVWELVAGAWTQVGATLSGLHRFGDAVDISADGSTLAVSSPSPNGSSRAGTVQVYRLAGGAWTQVGNVLQGEQIGDEFGTGLSLNADGSRLAVGAPRDREGGVSGGGDSAGKVRVFDLVGGSWVPIGGSLLGSVGLNGDNLGASVRLSSDGTWLAMNGPNQSIARVYRLVSGAWVQVGATLTNAGLSVARNEGLALSADGGTLALGFVNGSPRLVRTFSVSP
jgi:WD40 repeat protein